MKIKHAYGIVPGVSDGERPAECRGMISLVDRNGVTILYLAEPAAGSEENTGLRAQSEAKAAALAITERFDELYSAKDDFIRDAITVHDELQFVAVKENRYLAGHKGGGVIARLDGGSTVLSGPEAESRKKEGLRLYKGELQEPFGFMLISSGASRSLYGTGADSLSPACGTFFEWLKEYDGETVSEALADNINKYFLKETEGDIGVAMILSEEGDPGEEEAPAAADGPESEPESESETNEDLVPAARETAGESVKSRNYIKYLIAGALVVILAVVFVLTVNPPGDTGGKEQGKSEPKSKPPATLSKTSEPSVSFSADNPKSYDAGTYQVGEDIPPGEYFFWTGEMLKPDSVKVNDFTCLSGELYCLTVQVNEGDTLTSDYRFTAADNVDPVKPTNGVLISGKYKIGKDIAPGEYEISPIDKNKAGRYYSVSNGQISNDTEFNEQTTVAVPREGYIVFYNSALAVEQE